MNVAILIAARMKSTRLPKKCMAMIEDQPLISHLIDRMKLVDNASHVILCTSDDEDDTVLVEQAIKKDIAYVQGSKENVLDRFMLAADMVNADIIVRVTGDNPLTCPKYIERAITKHIEGGYDYTSTTKMPQGTKGEIINVNALKKAHELAQNPEFSEYMTWYFTKNPEHFVIGEGPVIENMVRPNYRLTVDHAEDLTLIRVLYNKFRVNGSTPDLQEVVQYLDEHPELLSINGSVPKLQISSEVNVKLNLH